MTIFSTGAIATRQVIGRVHRGRQLREALHELVDTHQLATGWINALGAFEWIELTEYNQATKQYEEPRRFTACELLSLQGNLSRLEGEPFWHVHATISRREGDRDEVYGGHVTDGIVFALEFRIDCFDDLTLQRTKDEPTGLTLWSTPQGPTPLGVEPDAAPLGSPPAPAPAPAPATGWAAAAEASAQTEQERAPVEHSPSKGDFIDHPKFGLCKVDGLSGDGVCIIKLPDARRKKIKLTAMQVLAPRREERGLVFPVRPRSKT